MPDIISIRQNRGKGKLMACVPCENCRQVLYPDSSDLKRYRVRQVQLGFLQGVAFYYSHVNCPATA